MKRTWYTVCLCSSVGWFFIVYNLAIMALGQLASVIVAIGVAVFMVIFLMVTW
jgi:hypothetical protein